MIANLSLTRSMISSCYLWNSVVSITSGKIPKPWTFEAIKLGQNLTVSFFSPLLIRIGRTQQLKRELFFFSLCPRSLIEFSETAEGYFGVKPRGFTQIVNNINISLTFLLLSRGLSPCAEHEQSQYCMPVSSDKSLAEEMQIYQNPSFCS